MIDLHMHSTASDGSLTPSEVARKCKEIGLEAAALTDHDTIDGIEEFMRTGAEIGLDVIRGMETSVSVDACDVHLVCLFYDPDNSVLQSELVDMKNSRAERNFAVIDKLRGLGYDISREDFKDLGGRAIARGHIAQVLKKRHFPDMTPKEIVHTYLDKGQIGYVRRRTPDPGKFTEIIHGAGGLVFVAHLNQIDPKDPSHGIAIFEDLVDMGVDGLETRYCEYNDFWRESTEALAVKYGLLRSGGSDFHGAIKPGLNLGTGYGDLEVPYSFLEAMREKLGR